MKIEFFPAAADELVEAAEIYESDARGLGREFILEVERVIGVLIELPSLAAALSLRTHIPARRDCHSCRRGRPSSSASEILGASRS